MELIQVLLIREAFEDGYYLWCTIVCMSLVSPEQIIPLLFNPFPPSTHSVWITSAEKSTECFRYKVQIC